MDIDISSQKTFIPPVDGEITVKVNATYSEALIMIDQAVNGGKTVTLADAKRALELNGVRFGIDEERLEEIFNTEYYGKSVQIATGIKPIDGENGTITYHFSQALRAAPKVDELGIADYRDLGLVTNIRAGDIIADIVLPTQGKAGKDVRGVEVPPIAGKKAPYIIGAGTMQSDDGLSLLARVDGNIRWNKTSFVVDEVLRLSDVDATTGNINFIGDIVIKGEVCEGFEVRSEKSISVGGNVTGAKLYAKGGIKIGLGATNAILDACGDIRTGFTENSRISCKGNLYSQSFVGCTVMCDGEIVAGNGKGVIVGGKYTCLHSITANNVGSMMFTKTYITLGNNAILTEEKLAIQNKIEEYKKQSHQLQQVYDLLTEQKKTAKTLTPEREAMLFSSIKSRYAIQGEIKALMIRIQDIDAMLSNKQDLALVCKRELFPGTTIRINSSVTEIEVGSVRCRAVLNDDGLIEIKPLVV